MSASRFLWLLLFVEVARAQSTGYIFVAPGRETTHTPASGLSAYGAGVGFEHVLVGDDSNNLGFLAINADAEGVVPGTGQASNTVGIFSLGGIYHFKQMGRYDLFALGGYSLVFRDFGASGFDFGGGVNIWFSSYSDNDQSEHHHALRIEFREQGARIPTEQPYTHTGPYTHYWGVRVGWVFGNRPGGS